MQVHLLVVMTAILIGSVAMTPAFAQQDTSFTNKGFAFAQPDFVFRIQTIIEDIRLGIASGADKVELIKEFAQDKQTRIDEALSRGETVSMAIEERRNDLLTSKLPQATITISEELETLGEMNEIRILYSQFDDCKLTCTEQDKQIFNDKVNSLDSWQNKCQGEFNIDQYEYSDSGFDKLSQKCPDLKQYDRNSLLQRISGNT